MEACSIITGSALPSLFRTSPKRSLQYFFHSMDLRQSPFLFEEFLSRINRKVVNELGTQFNWIFLLLVSSKIGEYHVFVERSRSVLRSIAFSHGIISIHYTISVSVLFHCTGINGYILFSPKWVNLLSVFIAIQRVVTAFQSGVGTYRLVPQKECRSRSEVKYMIIIDLIWR